MTLKFTNSRVVVLSVHLFICTFGDRRTPATDTGKAKLRRIKIPASKMRNHTVAAKRENENYTCGAMKKKQLKVKKSREKGKTKKTN